MKKITITPTMTFNKVNSIFQNNFGFGIFPTKSSHTLSSKTKHYSKIQHPIEIGGEMKLSELRFLFDTHMGIEWVTLPSVPYSCRLDEVNRYLNEREVYDTVEFDTHIINFDQEQSILGLKGLMSWNIPIDVSFVDSILDYDIYKTFIKHSGVFFISVRQGSDLLENIKVNQKVINELYTGEGDTITRVKNTVYGHQNPIGNKPRITLWRDENLDVGDIMWVSLPVGLSPKEVNYNLVWLKYGNGYILMDVEVTSQDGLIKYHFNMCDSSQEKSDDFDVTVMDSNNNTIMKPVWSGDKPMKQVREIFKTSF